MLGVFGRYIYTIQGADRVDLIDQVAVRWGWYRRFQSRVDGGAYREAVREQKIGADVSATSITTCCLAGQKSPPLSLQGHQTQTGCVRGHSGEEARGLGPPSESHSSGLVVQSPLWWEVPQRVSEQTPDLSFRGAAWYRAVGGEWHGYLALCYFVSFSFTQYV